MEKHFCWLNKNSLATLLQDKMPGLTIDDIESFEFEKNLEDTKNFTSSIQKICIEFKDKCSSLPRKIKLFTKTLGDNVVGQVFTEAGALEREILMLHSILPSMNQYLEIGDSFSPFAFRSPRPETIILEDLHESGYRPFQGQKQLGVNEATFILVKLAKFHAASVAVLRKDPDLAAKAEADSFFHEKGKSFFSNAMELSLGAVAKNLERWTEIENHVEFSRAINDLITRSDLMFQARNSNQYRFKTMIHGDLWLSNILFKVNNGKEIENVKFVDYQLSAYTSPVVDLHFFLFSSVQIDVLENSLDDLLRVYVTELSSSLAQFKVRENISYEEFIKDFNDSNFLSLIYGLVLPVIILDEPETKLSEDRSLVSALCSLETNYHYRFKHLPKFLKYLKKKCILHLRG